MTQFLLIVAIFAIATIGMAVSLHFSRYKKRAGSCCGGGHCASGGSHDHDGGHSCYNEKKEFVENYNKPRIKTDPIN